MIKLVGDKLKEIEELKAVYWLERPNKYPSATYEFIDEKGKEYTDEGEVETEYYLHVDVWSKGDYTSIVNKVKKKLSELGFNRISAYDDFEEDNKIYHKIIKFVCLKENESE